jgi:hypothetical protein
VLDWTLENLSADDVARLRAIYEPLTESVRALIDATIRTEVGAETVAAAKAEIDAATARLRSEQVDGPYGIRFTTDGDQMPWGNVVIGVRNPIAPPLVVEQSEGGGVFTDFHLGAAYEGPPGHVHGGVAAPLCSTTSWAPQPAARRSRDSPAPSRCVTCVLRGSVSCTRKPGLRGRTA